MLVFLVIDVPKKKNIRNESQSFNDLERVGRFLCEPQVDGTVQCVTDVHSKLNPQFHSKFITYKTETVSATENDHMENEQDARRVCALNWVVFCAGELSQAFEYYFRRIFSVDVLGLRYE